MLVDAASNYQPTLTGPPPGNHSAGGGGGGLAGTGSPVGTVAAAGTTYLDTDTGNFWVNQDGTSTNWLELISS